MRAIVALGFGLAIDFSMSLMSIQVCRAGGGGVSPAPAHAASGWGRARALPRPPPETPLNPTPHTPPAAAVLHNGRPRLCLRLHLWRVSCAQAARPTLAAAAAPPPVVVGSAPCDPPLVAASTPPPPILTHACAATTSLPCSAPRSLATGRTAAGASSRRRAPGPCWRLTCTAAGYPVQAEAWYQLTIRAPLPLMPHRRCCWERRPTQQATWCTLLLCWPTAGG